MSANLNRMKGRLAVMMACCGVGFLAAVAGFFAYFQFGQSWGRWFAVAALAIGFAGQLVLVISLRRDSKRT
jgi:hypothetical protein